MLVADIVRSNLLHRLAPPLATAGFDRQDVQHLVLLAAFQAIGKEHSDFGRARLKYGLDRMDQTA